MRSQGPPGIQTLVEQGVAASRRGAWQEAVQAFDQALQHTPRLTSAQRAITFHRRGLARARLRQLEAAVEDFSQAIQSDANFGLAYIDRGIARAQRGDFRRSLADLNRGLELSPNHPGALMARGLVHFELAALDKALADLTAAQQFAPNDSDIYLHRGNVHLARGDCSAAIADFEAAVQLNPTNPHRHNQLSWIYSTCRDSPCRNAEKALAHATTACELSGWRDFIILDTLAAALAASGQFDRALQTLEQALEFAPEGDRPTLHRHRESLRARKPYHELPA